MALLGHKADLGIMALGPDLWQLRAFQSDLASAGLDVVDSYVSLTELSEYAQGVPEELRQARLWPQLPPEGKRAWCFYPMSKRRNIDQNWFTLPYDERKALMYEHGSSGRKFAGRVLQVVTGSTGLDDFEWGVTLFAVRPDDLKEVVYTMRFDRGLGGLRRVRAVLHRHGRRAGRCARPDRRHLVETSRLSMPL